MEQTCTTCKFNGLCAFYPSCNDVGVCLSCKCGEWGSLAQICDRHFYGTCLNWEVKDDDSRSSDTETARAD